MPLANLGKYIPEYSELPRYHLNLCKIKIKCVPEITQSAFCPFSGKIEVLFGLAFVDGLTEGKRDGLPWSGLT